MSLRKFLRFFVVMGWIYFLVGCGGIIIEPPIDLMWHEFNNYLVQELNQRTIFIERLSQNSMKLDLINEALFNNNSFDIKPIFRSTLNKLARVLLKYHNVVIQVVGHTDSKGSYEYNQRLSERRAFAVADYLVYNGISSNRIHAEGRGESEPITHNMTVEGKRYNRRVEIYLNVY